MKRNLQHKEQGVETSVEFSAQFVLQQHTLPGGDGNLSQAVQQHGRGQADKRHHGAIEEFKLPHQDIRGLRTGRDLLHEVEIDLGDTRKKTKIGYRGTGSVLVCLVYFHRKASK